MKKFFFNLTKKIFFKICKLFETELPVTRLGSSYGGWYFSKNELTNNLIVVSAGVGEDISFDIEILNKFNSKIYFVDPTPRSITHMEHVFKNLGNQKSVEYLDNSGKQPIGAYDLLHLKKNNLIHIKKALYKKSGLSVKFYNPPNLEHVSYSISNFQNQYRSDTKFIEVETITVEDIIKLNDITKIDILKLDIEGAENQVIPSILKKKILPKQILVEFDELNSNFIIPYFKAIFILFKLNIKSYKMIKIDDFPNFLFLRKQNDY